ncbi:hypothetical protein EYC84_012069 [Monilinia fructicola]|uniref:Uncharacterized protein n=1 Tax=Monilinia fructicola TaxID=38448 RepID=A0A5M9J8C2_MONFR|nr:hypothetical protein EYC84_012069 [Monilinia fructicola]
MPINQYLCFVACKRKLFNLQYYKASTVVIGRFEQKHKLIVKLMAGGLIEVVVSHGGPHFDVELTHPLGAIRRLNIIICFRHKRTKVEARYGFIFLYSVSSNIDIDHAMRCFSFVYHK